MAESELPPMTFTEYKKLRAEGNILGGISESVALRLLAHLPKRYRYAQYIWSSVWLLSMPGFISISIFYRWWVGLLLLFTVTPTLYRAIKKSGAQFVLEHAENDEQFFIFLVENNLLIIKSV